MRRLETAFAIIMTLSCLAWLLPSAESDGPTSRPDKFIYKLASIYSLSSALNLNCRAVDHRSFSICNILITYNINANPENLTEKYRRSHSRYTIVPRRNGRSFYPDNGDHAR